MHREAVEEYVERSQQIIEASPQMNEENTKVKLVQPFLELLGWDTVSTEVELEYTIPMASGSTHVDYALLVGESPVVFVEVKPARAGIDEVELNQLKSYMRQELDVDWGILTNGKEFEVLTKSQRQDDGEEVAVARFNLDDLTESPEVLEILSKDAIRSGRADEIARQVARANEAIEYLEEYEDEVTAAVKDAMEGKLGKVPLDLEEQSREFVQNLAEVLREQRQFVSEEPPDGTDGPESPDGPDAPDRPDSPEEVAPLTNRITGTIARSEISDDPDVKVAVFPTRESGLPFLKENEAWGFVRVGSEFDYVAMYVTGNVKQVKYFAKVSDVVEPDEAELMREPLDYKNGAKIAEGKKVIEFEPGSLYELEDPVPYNSKYPQALRYTTLGELRSAETTDDML